MFTCLVYFSCSYCWLSCCCNCCYSDSSHCYSTDRYSTSEVSNIICILYVSLNDTDRYYNRKHKSISDTHEYQTVSIVSLLTEAPTVNCKYLLHV